MTINSTQPTWTFTPNPNLQVNSVAITDDGTRCVFGSSFERGTGDFATYLFDGLGNQIWKKPISNNSAYQGVFWVDVSADGEYFASGGEFSNTQDNASVETADKPGYLQAFASVSGSELLNLSLDSRVNQVSLSANGQYLAACYGHTVEVFQLNAENSQYNSIFKTTSIDYGINSCVISRDGSTVIASGIKYSDDSDDASNDSDTTTGKVFCYVLSGSEVTELGSCELSTGSMRVAVIDNGSSWAASLHDGSCVMFNKLKPNDMAWRCKPDNPDLILAYAVDITRTDTGEIFVACGANLSGTGDGGFLYLVKSVRMVYQDEGAEQGYPDPYFKGILQWSTDIKFGVNPGVSMDKNANYVTATDGKPDGKTVKESTGSFYLFKAETGDLIWKYDTDQMNWPMQISRDGNHVFGGSDDGSVYYWNLI